jgi:hemoglobin-like flavoprotein
MRGRMKLSIHPLIDPLPTGVVAGAQIDQRLIYRLRVSLAGLLAKGDALSAMFYGLLFERYPHLRELFPKDMTGQRMKLSQTLAWIVTYLDSHDQVLNLIRELGKRHVGYGAKPEHYPLIRDTLVEAMGRTAGAEWSEGRAEDWRLSIDLIARHMMAAGESRESSSPETARTTSTTPR